MGGELIKGGGFAREAMEGFHVGLGHGHLSQ